ncbi:hypothetical protein NSQ62_08010 [Solibacillus sp. FSL H8-0523]|uniref:hypothetical protein n=1 Tax=Solibacillus sp. FSL H8-0523 TaxID=2954511 RepID=UPI003100ACB1
MFYVTASDAFFSGWGLAHEKTNKIVVEVETFEEATRVHSKLKARHEMKYVKIATKRPTYPHDKYYVSVYDLSNNRVWLS